MYMRASLEKKNAFSHSKTAISFNILLVLQKLCGYTNGILVGLHVPTDFQMSLFYRKNSEKTLLGGGGAIIAPLPPSGYASALPYLRFIPSVGIYRK